MLYVARHYLCRSIGTAKAYASLIGTRIASLGGPFDI